MKRSLLSTRSGQKLSDIYVATFLSLRTRAHRILGGKELGSAVRRYSSIESPRNHKYLASYPKIQNIQSNFVVRRSTFVKGNLFSCRLVRFGQGVAKPTDGAVMRTFYSKRARRRLSGWHSLPESRVGKAKSAFSKGLVHKARTLGVLKVSRATGCYAPLPLGRFGCTAPKPTLGFRVAKTKRKGLFINRVTLLEGISKTTGLYKEKRSEGLSKYPKEKSSLLNRLPKISHSLKSKDLDLIPVVHNGPVYLTPSNLKLSTKCNLSKGVPRSQKIPQSDSEAMKTFDYTGNNRRSIYLRSARDGESDNDKVFRPSPQSLTPNQYQYIERSKSKVRCITPNVGKVPFTLPTALKRVLNSKNDSNPIKKIIYDLETYHRSNQDTCLIHRPAVFEGQWVESGDLLADCASSVGGELSLGQNILVGYMPWEGLNYEDAILISERLVYDDIYTSIHIERYEISVRETKNGPEEITKRISNNDIKDLYSPCLNLEVASRRFQYIEKVQAPVRQENEVKQLYKQRPFSLFPPFHDELLGRNLENLVRQERGKAESLKANSPIPLTSQAILIESSKKPASSTLETDELINKPISNSQSACRPVLLRNRPLREAFRLLIKATQQMRVRGKRPLDLCFFISQKNGVLFSEEKSTKYMDIPKIDFYLDSNLANIQKYRRDLNKVGNFYRRKKLPYHTPLGDEANSTRLARYLTQKKRTKQSEVLHGFCIESDKTLNILRAGYGPKYIKNGSSFADSTYLNRRGDPLFTAHLDDNGIAKIGSWIEEGTILVGKITPLNIKEKVTQNTKPINNRPYQKLLYNILGGINLDHRSEVSFRDSSVRAPKGIRAKVIDIQLTYQKKDKKSAAPDIYRSISRRSQADSLLSRTQNILTREQGSTREGRVVQGFTLHDQPFSSPAKRDLNLGPPLSTKAPIQSVKMFLAEKRRIQVGDKLSGRHGNKGILSQILPREDMPFLPDGTPLDLVLNPLGVPSRMNVGQIYECLLGLAGKFLGEHYRCTAFDEMYGAEASRSFVFSKLFEARKKTGFKWLFNPNWPGKIKIFDGRTGEYFDQAITVGQAYILKLVHMVDDKMHARSTGPYSLVTQQPLRGRSKQGGQRLGEMEVWALEGYGAAFTLLEMLTLKSDDMTGRMTLWSNLILNKDIFIGTPESFKVLVSELQALCLDIGLFKQYPNKKYLKEIDNLMNLP